MPSVDPVSTITQLSISLRTLSRQRPITGASFLTIIFRQIFCPEGVMLTPRVEGIGLLQPENRSVLKVRVRRNRQIGPIQTESEALLPSGNWNTTGGCATVKRRVYVQRVP